MPRIRQNAERDSMKDFRAEIDAQCGRYGYRSQRALSQRWIYRDAIYNAVIAAGGLRGNRANPKQTKAYIALKQTKAPAVLMEYGFMDSKVDAPIILTEEYAKAVAYATMEGIALVAGLQKKPQTTLYRVQVGAFAKREYAQAMVAKLAKAGFEGYIKTDN